MNFLKNWMSVHIEQALAAPEPLFARHHVYPVRPCLFQHHFGCLSVSLLVHPTDCLSCCLTYLCYLSAALISAALMFERSLRSSNFQLFDLLCRTACPYDCLPGCLPAPPALPALPYLPCPALPVLPCPASSLAVTDRLRLVNGNAAGEAAE